MLDRDAGSREVLGEGRIAVARRADEPIEPAHRPCGQVVQHDERFGLCEAHLKTSMLHAEELEKQKFPQDEALLTWAASVKAIYDKEQGRTDWRYYHHRRFSQNN